MKKVGFSIRFTWIVLIIISVVAVWGTSGLIIYYAFDNWGDRGTMGDMFGAVNSLFSMNTVISYYNNRIKDASDSTELIEKAKQKRKAIIRQIDDLIDGLDDVSID